MNKSLEEVLQIVAQLPTTQQEAIASQILQQITALPETPNGELPDPEVLAYMEQQAAIFEQMKPELLQKYSNLYVLFENGQVVDADENEAKLVLRAYSKNGARHLFVKKVTLEEAPLNIRGFSPFC